MIVETEDACISEDYTKKGEAMYFLNSNSDFWSQKAIAFLMKNEPLIRVSIKILENLF